MRYFTILDFQHWVAALFIGGLLPILAYVSWSGYVRRKAEKLDLSDDTMPLEPPESEHHSVAPILIFIYIGTFFWMIAYLLMVGLAGGPIK